MLDRLILAFQKKRRNSMQVFGIDISYWQKGYPYDKANAEGVKFAILRAGYATTKDTGDRLCARPTRQYARHIAI